MVIAVVVYWTIPRHREWVLTAVSIAFLASLDWVSVTALLAWSTLFYRVGEAMRTRPGLKRLTKPLIIGLLLFLAWYKYLPILRGTATAHTLIVPLGISYWTFKLIHYLVECSRGRLQGQPAHTFFLWVSFFPIYGAGPIERFDLFLKGRAERWSSAFALEGLTRIAYGVIKKFVLADIVFSGWANYLDLLHPVPPMSSHSGFIAWRTAVSTYAYGYFDFSGYSDIAIGCSLFFGIRIMENFNWPFLASNINEFWKRWHISLSSWCQMYIYLPIIGRTRNPYLATFATMLVIGVWHNGGVGYIAWGAYHATLIILYSVWTRTKRARKWKFDGRLANVAAVLVTIAAVSGGEVLLATDSIPDTLVLWRRMLGLP